MGKEENLAKFEEEMEAIKKIPSFKEIYDKIIMILDDYMDIDDGQKMVVALWIMATAFKECFETFPILYVNAPRASGKTRLLKIMKDIIDPSLLTTNLTEAVLFRVPVGMQLRALLIDEAEKITDREKGNLRELLNSCYKRGIDIIRMKKDQKTGGYEVERFEIFVPTAIANIYGLEGIVEDRSLTITLERSINRDIIRKVEVFNLDERFDELKEWFKNAPDVKFGVGSVCRMVVSNTYDSVVTYINGVGGNPTSYITHTTDTSDIILSLLEKIDQTELSGRDFELWLPLIVMASVISQDLATEVISYAENYVSYKKEVNVVEDNDTTFLLFLFNFIQGKDEKEFFSVSKLRSEFREQEGITDSKAWPSSEWIGRAMKRMKMIRMKHRLSRGREVQLNFSTIEGNVKNLGFDLDTLKESLKVEKEKESIVQETLGELK